MDQNQSLFKKNIFKILILAFAGSIIYGLPYFRYYYYDAYVSAYGLTNTQMGVLGSAYGVLGVLSYLIGGVLADKFSAKKLLIFSLIATGLGGIVHLLHPTFQILVALYAVWGVVSLMTFWPALMKIVRMQGNPDEQSRSYGLFEGGRGATNIIHTSIATAIFGLFQAKTVQYLGINWIIVFYTVCPILCGVLFMFIIKDDEGKVETSASTKFKFSDIIAVLKMPAVWMVSLITYTTYTFNLSYFYFTPYATNVLKASAVFGAVVGVLSQYCRPIGAPVGGFLADKIGKAKVMLVGYIVMVLGTVAIMHLPSGPMQLYLLIGVCAVFYLAMYSNFGIYFSMLTEGGVPIEYAGIAIGVVSTLGYLPEVVCPFLAGKTLDAYKGSAGYHIYFTYMIIVGIVGAIAALIWMKMFNKQKAAAKEAKA